MYFVASEHITRWKLAYKLLDFCFKPIIRAKGTTASSTVMEMLRTIRSGANVMCLIVLGLVVIYLATLLLFIFKAGKGADV